MKHFKILPRLLVIWQRDEGGTNIVSLSSGFLEIGQARHYVIIIHTVTNKDSL